MTGFVGLRELPDKQMELFKEIVPRLHRLLVLIAPKDPATERLLTEVRRVSSMLELNLFKQRLAMSLTLIVSLVRSNPVTWTACSLCPRTFNKNSPPSLFVSLQKENYQWCSR